MPVPPPKLPSPQRQLAVSCDTARDLGSQPPDAEDGDIQRRRIQLAAVDDIRQQLEQPQQQQALEAVINAAVDVSATVTHATNAATGTTAIGAAGAGTAGSLALHHTGIGESIP